MHRGGRLVPVTQGETVRDWMKRFHKSKEARGLESVEDMRGRAENLAVVVVGTLILGALKVDPGLDATREADYGD